MILGPPGPTTPRHKKYSTKGTKESPQFSPRLGRTKLHLVLALELYFLISLLIVLSGKKNNLFLFHTT